MWQLHVNLWSKKTWKGHGNSKSHGKQWNLKSSKEYKPCQLVLIITGKDMSFGRSYINTMLSVLYN